MRAGDDAVGSGAGVVQGERPEQDAVQHLQLSQRELAGEKVLQGMNAIPFKISMLP